MRKILLSTFAVVFYMHCSYAQWVTSGSNIYYNSGNVGIGSTTPAAPLDHGGTVGVKQLMYGSNGNIGYYMGFGVDLGQAANTLAAFIGPPAGDGTNGPASFSVASATSTWPYSSYTTRFTVLSSGNVGIGTTTPLATLDVNGIINLPNNTALSFGNSASQIYRNSTTGGIQFTGTGGANTMFINDNGSVGIGTSHPQSLFSVAGGMTAKSLVITQSNWSDFVFDSTYRRMSLDSIAFYVTANKHLPDVPSAAQIKSEGMDVGDMQKLQMQKIEELTLYVIEANRQMQQLKEQLKAQREEIDQLKQLIQSSSK